MSRRIVWYSVFSCLIGLTSATTVFAEPMEPGRAFTKLTRGVVNVFTGWVEVPKRIHQTSSSSGAAAGWTWGLLRGLGHGFIRTAAGFYETFTFPFPAPPGYQPVIQPEFVFTEEATSDSSYR